MKKARELFSNRLGFILAAAGSAVGLGNIWRFPFEVGHGGGAAFVFIYLICCFLLCFPVMIVEIAIGRKTSSNPVSAFQILGFRRWKFVGFAGILCGVLILSFYHVIAGWVLDYFVYMVSGNFNIDFSAYTADISSNLIFTLLFTIFTAFIVSRGVTAGIETLSKFLMPTLFIMIISLIVYALTLPNAWVGVSFYLLPDLSEISLSTIDGALRQSFFSLSLGMGALITYGSYLSRKDNIITSATWIVVLDVAVALIAGLMVFPLVAYNNGGNMDLLQAQEGGPGLIFITLPKVFASFGTIGGSIVGGLFFLLLCFAALTSTVSLLEVPVAYTMERFKTKRGVAVTIVATLIFLLGIPSILAGGASDFFTHGLPIPGGSSDFLSLISTLADSLLLFGGTFIVFFAAYVWKKENLSEEICSGYAGYKQSLIRKIINFLICYFCPFVLAILFLVVFWRNFIG